MHMKITYIQVVLSLIIKGHIYQSKYDLLFNQYGDEQKKSAQTMCEQFNH